VREGAVSQRSGSVPPIRHARLLQLVREGDEIRVPTGGAAVLVCATDQAVRLPGGAQQSLTEDLCRAGTPLPPGTYQDLAPRGGRLRSVGEALVLERQARAPEDDEKESSVLLRPRNTMVIEPRPEIVWTKDDRAKSYQIQVLGEISFSHSLEASQVHCAPVVGSSSKICSTPYPADQPELPPGGSAIIQITSWWEPGPSTGARKPVWVRRLPAEQAAEVSAQAKILAGLPLGKAARLLLEANLYAENRMYGSAIEIFHEVLLSHDTPEGRITLGDSYAVIGLFSRARRAYQEALSADPEPEVRAAATFGLGKVEHARGDFRRARQLFREAHKIYSGLGLEEETTAAAEAEDEASTAIQGAFEILLQTDPMLVDLDEVEGLIVEWTGALREAEKAGEEGKLAWLLRDLGELQWVLAQAYRYGAGGGLEYRQKSEELLRRALEVASRVGEPGRGVLMDTKLRLSEVLVFLSKSADALALAEKALREARRDGPTASIAAALRALARVHIDRKSWPEALQLLEEAQRLEPVDGGWTLGRVETLAEVVDLHFWKKQPDRVWEPLLEAATGCVKLGLPGEHRLIGRIAEGYFYLLNPDKPLLANPVFRGQRLRELARLHEDDDIRLVVLLRAWAIAREHESAFELAGLLFERGRLEQAERVLSQTYDRVPWMRSNERWAVQLIKAEILRRKGAAGEARVILKVLQNDILSAYFPGNPFDRSYWWQRSARSLVDSDVDRCDFAALSESLPSLLQAERTLIDTMIREVSETRFRSVALELASEDELFGPVVRCASRDQALLRATVERLLLRREIWRYRAQIVGNSRRLPELARSVEELLELRKLRAQLRLRTDDAALSAELAKLDIPSTLSPPEGESPGMVAVVQLEFQIDLVEDRLAESLRRGRFSGQRTETTHPWSSLTRMLGTDGVLVGYLPVEVPPDSRRLVAFVVDGEGAVSWADLGDWEVIRGCLEGTWASLPSRSDDVKVTLRRAGQQLFDPIEADLRGKRRVSLLASGPVRFLPWSTLVDSQDRFLGERFADVWLQSAADLLPDDIRASAPREVALLAPEYERVEEARLVVPLSSRLVSAFFRPLPGAGRELADLSELFRGRNIAHRLLRGAAVTEEAVRELEPPRVLHIAAHGFRIPAEIPLTGGAAQVMREWVLYWPNRHQGFLEPSFLRVGVALSGGNRGGTLRQDDGLLTASEAADLDLHGTSLVVLSSCETAYPTLQDAGGAYDLALGFRMAGAGSVVGSLWEVDDRAASILMKEMYRLLTEGAPVAEALWEAKRKLRSDPAFSHPYDWAPFQVLGTGQAVWPARKRVEKAHAARLFEN